MGNRVTGPTGEALSPGAAGPQDFLLEALVLALSPAVAGCASPLPPAGGLSVLQGSGSR